MKRTPYKGQDFSKEEVLTIPKQSMSLAEIIARFTRNESVDVGFPVNYHESEDDLEKLRHLDPVDRAAYIQKMKDVQEKFHQQEEKRKRDLEEKARAEFFEKLKKEAAEAVAVDSTAKAK